MREPIPPRSLDLIDLIAAEHRLRRQARREQAEVERWEHRAAFAEARGLGDLADAARGRVERHAHMARLLTGQAVELMDEIEFLRRELQPGRGVGRSPPAEVSLEARFAELAIERELEEIRGRMANSAPGPAPPEALSA